MNREKLDPAVLDAAYRRHRREAIMAERPFFGIMEARSGYWVADSVYHKVDELTDAERGIVEDYREDRRNH